MASLGRVRGHRDGRRSGLRLHTVNGRVVHQRKSQIRAPNVLHAGTKWQCRRPSNHVLRRHRRLISGQIARASPSLCDDQAIQATHAGEVGRFSRAQPGPVKTPGVVPTHPAQPLRGAAGLTIQTHESREFSARHQRWHMSAVSGFGLGFGIGGSGLGLGVSNGFGNGRCRASASPGSTMTPWSISFRPPRRSDSCSWRQAEDRPEGPAAGAPGQRAKRGVSPSLAAGGTVRHQRDRSPSRSPPGGLSRALGQPAIHNITRGLSARWRQSLLAGAVAGHLRPAWTGAAGMTLPTVGARSGTDWLAVRGGRPRVGHRRDACV
jgi:hypothetical protein